jgi:anion-transporting  ArsA/GET3 family ATPase
LVKQYAANDEQVQRILTNRIYHNLSTALSATQEYMAAEKLYEIYSKSEFDLIVVDTPPTRNALDFLEAPGRLTRFLENRFFRLILMPTRAYLKAFNVATRTFLHTVAKVAGSEVVSDALAFFQVFEGMEEGFINRAKQVQLLLSSDAVGFVVVTTAKRDATTEAAYFIGKLGHYNIKASALVINRIYPSFLKDKKALMNLKSFQRDHEEQQNRKTKLLISNLCDLMTISESENAIISKLVDKISISQVYKVPLMDIDIHDLDGLSYIGNALNT